MSSSISPCTGAIIYLHACMLVYRDHGLWSMGTRCRKTSVAAEKEAWEHVWGGHPSAQDLQQLIQSTPAVDLDAALRWQDKHVHIPGVWLSSDVAASSRQQLTMPLAQTQW